MQSNPLGMQAGAAHGALEARRSPVANAWTPAQPMVGKRLDAAADLPYENKAAAAKTALPDLR